MRPKFKIATLAAAMVATLSVVPLSPANAQPASVAADDCTPPPHPYNGDGGGNMKGTYNLKVAPYASCANVRSLAQGTHVYYLCWLVNTRGNVWEYVRVQGTTTYGWMSWDNITDTWDNDVPGTAYEEANCAYGFSGAIAKSVPQD
jgi:hypothetical protein